MKTMTAAAASLQASQSHARIAKKFEVACVVTAGFVFSLALGISAASAAPPFTNGYFTNFQNLSAETLTPFANGASWPPSEGVNGPNQYPGKIWMYDLPWGWPTNSGGSDPSDCNQGGSRDAQCYNPLSAAVNPAGLSLNAQNVPSPRFPGLAWQSGAITSNPNYPFTYGFFQARLFIQPSSGFNQAISIYHANLAWDFELDPFQFIGLNASNQPSTSDFFLDNTANWGSSTTSTWITNTPCTGWHTVGEDVEPTGTTFYFDNKAIWSAPWTAAQQAAISADPSFIVTFGQAVGLANSWEGAPPPGVNNVSMIVRWFKWNKSGTFTTAKMPFLPLPP
jgi:hypothetical protein